MNKDQDKRVAKYVAGKVLKRAGKPVGSKEQQINGISKQISGKAQKGVGGVKQAGKNINKAKSESASANEEAFVPNKFG